mmetsp:Transcript_25718/g.42797  ORF Transcript_25718/g.42797 Transcript_25718/m.42797 type:complete len:334 (+) Transcript_25718:2082-3083(+)
MPDPSNLSPSPTAVSPEKSLSLLLTPRSRDCGYTQTSSPELSQASLLASPGRIFSLRRTTSLEICQLVSATKLEILYRVSVLTAVSARVPTATTPSVGIAAHAAVATVAVTWKRSHLHQRQPQVQESHPNSVGFVSPETVKSTLRTADLSRWLILPSEMRSRLPTTSSSVSTPSDTRTPTLLLSSSRLPPRATARLWNSPRTTWLLSRVDAMFLPVPSREATSSCLLPENLLLSRLSELSSARVLTLHLPLLVPSLSTMLLLPTTSLSRELNTSRSLVLRPHSPTSGWPTFSTPSTVLRTRWESLERPTLLEVFPSGLTFQTRPEPGCSSRTL